MALTEKLAAAIRRLLGRGMTQAEVDAINAAMTDAPAPDPAPTGRSIGPKGLALIKRWEGCKLTAYRCPAGVWTIGYGSTGPHVVPGKSITADEAERLLRKDLARFEAAVNALGPTTQERFDALVSLAFNIGVKAFAESTLARLHKAGQHEGAALQFGKWVNAGGKRLNGLVKRRADEAALYRSSAR